MYLGSLLAEDGYCEKEIRARVAMAKDTFKRCRSLFTASFDPNLKKRFIKCLYGVYSCTAQKHGLSRKQTGKE